MGYFYARASEKGRPAPVLEAPLSYCLLYDEVWFFTRNMCPYNMEGLDFVHFVDEELEPKGLPKDAIPEKQMGRMGEFPWEEWNEVIDATIGKRWSDDNHSRPLKFGELRLLPTPGNYENLLVDRYIAAQYGMDLVENTANAIWSKELGQNSLKMQISERFMNSKIASLQTIDGPWHPMIAELRSDGLLKWYTEHVGEIQDVSKLAEVDTRVQELSDAYEEVVDELAIEHVEWASVYYSTAEYVGGWIPVAGQIAAAGTLLAEVGDKMQARRQDGWVGFLAKARKLQKRRMGGQTE